MSLLDDRRYQVNGDRAPDLSVDAPVPTALALIKAPGGSHNRYTWDTRHEKIRLMGMLRYDAQAPVDRGYILDASLRGEPLEVWVVRSNPVPADVLVEVRIIGIAERVEHLEPPEPAESAEPEGPAEVGAPIPFRPVLLGVPVVDRAFDTVFEPAHLSGSLWSAVHDLLAKEWKGRVKWGSSDEAAVVLRESRKRHHLERNAKRQTSLPDRPLWQAEPGEVSDSGAHVQPAPNETARYSSVEYSFHTIPLRFQRDLAQCLLPDERILFYVYRPEFSVRRSLLRRARYNEGMVVVTDRQVLWLVDTYPPDSTMIHWGYNAQSLVVERLASAEIVEHGSYAELVLAARAASGKEVVRIPFPESDAPTEALGHIRPFMPEPGSRALRRVVEPRAPRRSVVARRLQDEADLSFLPVEVQDGLWARHNSLIEPDERLLGQALAAAIPDLKVPGRMVTLTTKRLIEAGVTGEAKVFPIAEISSVQMQHSLWGSVLAVTLPHEGGAITNKVRFNAPQHLWFQPLFALLCQCMTAPYGPSSKDSEVKKATDALIFTRIAASG